MIFSTRVAVVLFALFALVHSTLAQSRGASRDARQPVASEETIRDRINAGTIGLAAAGFDPKWKDVNLNTQVPGLERLQAVQEWLDRSVPKSKSARP
jgi:hypothetical protein